jgi:hypothetical protein
MWYGNIYRMIKRLCGCNLVRGKFDGGMSTRENSSLEAHNLLVLLNAIALAVSQTRQLIAASNMCLDSDILRHIGNERNIHVASPGDTRQGKQKQDQLRVSLNMS